MSEEKTMQFIDEFSRSLYLILANEKPKENLIVSPISVQIVLAMALQGAEGNTAKELIHGLKIENADKKTIQKQFNSLLNNLTGGDDLILNIANKIYSEKTMNIKSEFSEILKTHFQTAMGLVNFKNEPENARVEINNWVADKTNQLIQNLIPEEVIKSDTRLVLVNAIHFKGKWKFPFDVKKTKTGNFNLDKNTKVKVDYMNIKNKFNYTDLPDINAKAVELEYTGGNYSLLIILPNQVNGLKELQGKLSDLSLSEIREKMYQTEVIIKLPKFKIESTLFLNSPLKQLGMDSMFSTNSNFSGITGDTPLRVTIVIQKAYIDVNEEGTEAAAATAMVMVARRMMIPQPPKEFYVEQPFAYMLINRKINSPLFAGHIMNPEYK